MYLYLQGLGSLCFLFAMAREDERSHRILNRQILRWTVWTFFASLLWRREDLLLRLGEGAGLFLLLALFSMLARGAFGMGDAKLVSVAVFAFGGTVAFTIFFLSLVFTLLRGGFLRLSGSRVRSLPLASQFLLATLLTLFSLMLPS